MPHTSRAEKSLKSCNEDRISALPDDVLHHVLGFLQADEAVRTCLLARRWRYLWKSMRCLRIKKMGRWGSSTDVFLTKFVSCMLLLRDPGSTLDEVKIEYERHFDDDHTWTSTWIHHALSCQAQVLTVKFPLQLFSMQEFSIRYLDGPPLVSQYLRRLQISDVRLKSNFLNFSSCSTLEYLKIKDCNLETSSILSQSLKHLSIEDCYFKNDARIRISVPNLVSLQLKSCVGRTPWLESILSLETAVVRPQICMKNCCPDGFVAGECCGTCPDCCGNDGHKGGCVLLGGLSHAKNLELVAHPIMQNKPTGAVEVEENPGLMEKPAAISGYLKTIKVTCEEVDDRVCKVLKFLSTFGIAITIQRTNG